MHIRSEQEQDFSEVSAIHEAAFDTTAEARLVVALREQALPLVSLVAEEEGRVVGHILFSPVEFSNHAELKLMGLAPMAVLPGRQRQGIGSELVRAGLEACRELGAGAVVVLGHPGYYPRFGFSPAERFGVGCQYEVPPEAFMLVEFVPNYLQGASGIVEYHAFADL